MAGLLVSVRSVDEARAAAEGGASLVDVKEPDRGPLGRADASVWLAVRAALPVAFPMSVALGELAEWPDRAAPASGHLAGITYCKLGLAGASPGWRERWSGLRRAWGAGPAWVAVAYSDWRKVRAPSPDAVLESALAAGDLAAVLVDTWDKSAPSDVDNTWLPWIARARGGGLKVALAGGLGQESILRLAGLEPDWFAVRGAACREGRRGAAIDPGKVARLADLVARL